MVLVLVKTTTTCGNLDVTHPIGVTSKPNDPFLTGATGHNLNNIRMISVNIEK
jgi:hypothetical protein